MTAGSSPPLRAPIRYSWSGPGCTRSCRWCGPVCHLSPGRWAYPPRSSHTGPQSSRSYTGTCWAPYTLLRCGRLVHIWLQKERIKFRSKVVAREDRTQEIKSMTFLERKNTFVQMILLWKSSKRHSPTRQSGPSQPGLQQHLPVGVQCPFLHCLEQAVISSSGGSTWRWHSLGAWGLQQMSERGEVNMWGTQASHGNANK